MRLLPVGLTVRGVKDRALDATDGPHRARPQRINRADPQALIVVVAVVVIVVIIVFVTFDDVDRLRKRKIENA